MQIYVTTLSGRRITIEIDGSDTLLDLKCKVLDKEGIPLDKQRFIHCGVQLEDDGLVLDQINAIQTRQFPNEPNRASSYINLHLVLRLRGGGNEIYHRPLQTDRRSSSWSDQSSNSDLDDELPQNGPSESTASNGDNAIGQKQIPSETGIHDLAALDLYTVVKGLPDSLKKNLKKGIHIDDTDLSRGNESTSNIHHKKEHSFLVFLSKAGISINFVILVIAAAAFLVPKAMRKDSKVELEAVGSIAFSAILLMVTTAFVLLAIQYCRPSLTFQSLKEGKQNMHLERINQALEIIDSMLVSQGQMSWTQEEWLVRTEMLGRILRGTYPEDEGPLYRVTD